MIPESVHNFIKAFSRLPAIGPRLATRLAFFLISLGKSDFESLEKAFSGLKSLDRCPRCFFAKERKSELCNICGNPGRDRKTILIVEKETDVLSMENASAYKGVYLVLGEISPDGGLEGYQETRLKNLVRMVEEENGKDTEIVLGLEANSIGDFAADTISGILKGHVGKITRLARGIPTGGAIEFADEETLRGAFEGRK